MKRLTEDEVRAIREGAAAGETQTSLARRFGVSIATVNMIVHRRTWQHVAPEIPAPDSARERGSRHHNARLTEDQVLEIRRLNSEDGWSYRRLARKYGVSEGTIQLIVEGKTWRHLLPGSSEATS